MGLLYLVPTPLGNLEDITLRALRVLSEVQLVATEDTRTTGRLLKHYEISCPLLSYHEYNEAARIEQMLAALNEGDVALVSEAGMPLFSDPGHKLVQAAIEHGITVVALPGPSALTAALPASGLAVDGFSFFGFLPRKAKARRDFLTGVATLKHTLVFFEAPHRLVASLADMADVLGKMRSIAVCRELTKLHEEIWRGTLAEAWQEWQERPPRGEFTLVVSGAPQLDPAWKEQQVVTALTEMIQAGSGTKAAAQTVADQSGWSKKELYKIAQEVKKDVSFKK